MTSDTTSIRDRINAWFAMRRYMDEIERSALVSDTLSSLVGAPIDVRGSIRNPTSAAGTPSYAYVNYQPKARMQFVAGMFDPANTYWNRKTVMHEAGHIFDMALRVAPQLSRAVEEGYRRYMQMPRKESQYRDSDPREYFAELFAHAVDTMSMQPSDFSPGGDPRMEFEHYVSNMEQTVPGFRAIVDYLRRHPKYSAHWAALQPERR